MTEQEQMKKKFSEQKITPPARLTRPSPPPAIRGKPIPPPSIPAASCQMKRVIGANHAQRTTAQRSIAGLTTHRQSKVAPRLHGASAVLLRVAERPLAGHSLPSPPAHSARSLPHRELQAGQMAKRPGEAKQLISRLPGSRAALIRNSSAPAGKTSRVPQLKVPSITVQRFASRVVQAVKFYPNLHPGAVEPVNQDNLFRLDSFASQYRLHRVNSHSVNVPNQQYNFVRTREGEMLLHARYRHPSIAEGKQVLYAGEIFFNNGQLEWWSNGSGHYQPYPEDAEQASLPMDQFFSYQQIIKGEHKRRKG